eukprot:25797_1
MTYSRLLTVVTVAVVLISRIKVSYSLVDPFDLICGGDINPLEIILNPIQASCGSGWSDYGVGCIENCKSGYSTWDELSCSENCGSLYEEFGHICQKTKMCGWLPCGIDVYFRDTYLRAHKAKNVCPSGTNIFDGELCFKSCSDSYIMGDIMKGEFDVCVCDDLLVLVEMADLLLNKKSALVSVGTSCITELYSLMSESDLFDTIISKSQMNNPENFWLPAKDALDTFSSCIDTLLSRRRMTDENSDEHIWALEFGYTRTEIESGSLSIGILFNPLDETRQYYATACTGIMTNAEADAFTALTYFKDIDSIDATSIYEILDIDLKVVGRGFSYEEDMESFSLSFEVGAEILPIAYGGGVCTTTWIF